MTSRSVPVVDWLLEQVLELQERARNADAKFWIRAGADPQRRQRFSLHV